MLELNKSKEGSQMKGKIKVEMAKQISTISPEYLARTAMDKKKTKELFEWKKLLMRYDFEKHE